MKELSIEEKAQRYDDLLVKLQEAKVDNDVCDERYCCVIDDIVPELAESKDESNDEKIRKVLVELISTFLRGHENGKIHGVYAKDILAWLEKQGEKDEEILILKDKIESLEAARIAIQELHKPAEWSEEDEKMFEHIIAKATLHFSSINYLDEEEINFLKSLRHQPHWKPSERQKEALLWCVIHLVGADKQTLGELLEELNKL